MWIGEAPGIGTASNIAVGVTTISLGTTGRLLYDNAAVLGETVNWTTDGTVLTGAATTSIAVGGATIGTNTLGVAGTVGITGTSLAPVVISSTDAGAVAMVLDLYRNSASPAASDVTAAVALTGNSSTGVKRTYAQVQAIIGSATNTAEFANLQFQAMNNGTLTTGATIDFSTTNRLFLGTGINGIGGNGNQLTMGYTNTGVQAQFTTNGLNFIGSLPVGWGAGTFGTIDAMFTRRTAATINLGAADVDTGPVAQSLSVQSALAGGTSDVAGVAFTIKGSQGKGTGVGGAVVIQTAPAGSTGTAVNALVNAVSIAGAGITTFLPTIAPPASGASTAGILMSSTALLGLYFGSGSPTFVAAQGSAYIRTDGSSISSRFYVNTNGSTTWTNFVSAA